MAGIQYEPTPQELADELKQQKAYNDEMKKTILSLQGHVYIGLLIIMIISALIAILNYTKVVVVVLAVVTFFVAVLVFEDLYVHGFTH